MATARVAFVTVSPAHQTLPAGSSRFLTATPRDSTGASLTNRPLTWSSSDSTKVMVSPSGEVRALATGLVTITAASEDTLGTAVVYVPPRVASVAVTPDSVTLLRRDTVRLAALVRDSKGAPLARAIVWRSLDSTIAFVDADGLIVGWEAGRTGVYAESEGIRDTAWVEVTWGPVSSVDLDLSAPFVPIGFNQTALVWVSTQGGTPTGYPVSVVSRDPAIAIVYPGVGDQWRVVAQAAGRTMIVAEAGGQRDSAEVVVEHPAATITVVPETVVTAIGTNIGLHALVRDSSGTLLRFPTVTWSSSDTTIAGIIAAFVAVPKRAGIVQVEIVSGTARDTGTLVVTVQREPTPVFVPNVAHRLPPGDSLGIQVDVQDSVGGSVSGVPVRLTSLDTSVVTVSPSQFVSTGPTTVTLHGRGVGQAILVAEAPGGTSLSVAFVTYEYIASLRILTRPTIVRVGDSVPLSVELRDLAGNLRAYPVTWTSSDSTVATVSDGLLRGLGVGSATLVATGFGRTDSIRVGVMPATAPVITSIAPDTMIPGGTAVITGANFDPTPAANTVTIDGTPIPVLAASATALTVQLPPAAQLPCRATGTRRLTVTVGPLYGDTLHPVRFAPRRAVPSGGALLLLGPGESRCTEFMGDGGQYHFVLAYSDPSPGATASALLRSVPLPAVVSAAALRALDAPEVIRQRGSASWLGPDSASLRRATATHASVLAGNARELQPALVAAPTVKRAGSVIDLRLGAISAVRVPLIYLPTYCSSYTTVLARTVYVGAHTIVLEDLTAPLAGRMDAELRSMGQEFDGAQYNVVATNFGSPVARDGVLDGDGRVALLFSPAMNQFGGLGAFVVACDLLSQSQAPSSNEAEVLYAAVPLDTGGFEGPGTIAVWRWIMRGALVHQAKHLASYAERLARGLGPEDFWLEEATAMVAEEIWARSIYGTTWKGAAVYQPTLYCDVRPTWPECQGRPFVMFRHFSLLHDDLLDSGRRSFLTVGDGAAWAFLRWAVDAYATSEATFLRALVVEPTATGTGNIVARTGRPFAELLADWTSAIALPPYDLTVSRPHLSIPSWDLHDVFAGMSADFPTDFHPWPLIPRDMYTDQEYSAPFMFRAGGTTILRIWFATTGAQLIELRGPGGSLAAPGLIMEIVRLQ